MNKYVPMGQRVREAGDQAVPMLVDILIRAAAQTPQRQSATASWPP